MKELSITSNSKIWQRKMSMLLYALAPLLGWYTIAFPVDLGYALLLFLAIYALACNGLRFNVLPVSFISVILYVCIMWSYHHNFELWTLFPPGGWVFCIFVLSILGGVIFFDFHILKTYIKWVCYISIVLFWVQFILLVFTGSQQFCFVPNLTGSFNNGTYLYTDVASKHLASSYPCSIFLEKSYMAYYLIAFLALEWFSDELRDKWYDKKILLVIITLIVLRSGSGLVGLSVLGLTKVITLIKSGTKKRKITTALFGIPIVCVMIFGYLNTGAGQELLARQDEFTTENTSGYTRVIGGYLIYDTFTTSEKITGNPEAEKQFSIERSDGFTMFYVNGIQSILINGGIICIILYIVFYASLFRKICIVSRMCIVSFVTMAFLESNYLNTYMILMTVIPCADYYYSYKLKLKSK